MGIAAFAVVLDAIVVPLPRHIPAATAAVRTLPAGTGLVDVTVSVTPASAVVGADLWEVMAWQGGGFVVAPLLPAAEGTWRTALAVPAGGEWKTLLRLAKGPLLGGMAIAMPADPEIGARAVPLQPSRTDALVADQTLFLREAHHGPRWPGLVAYTVVGLSLAAILASLVAGTAGLERRRRVLGWQRRRGDRRSVRDGAQAHRKLPRPRRGAVRRPPLPRADRAVADVANAPAGGRPGQAVVRAATPDRHPTVRAHPSCL